MYTVAVLLEKAVSNLRLRGHRRGKCLVNPQPLRCMRSISIMQVSADLELLQSANEFLASGNKTQHLCGSVMQMGGCISSPSTMVFSNADPELAVVRRISYVQFALNASLAL